MRMHDDVMNESHNEDIMNESHNEDVIHSSTSQPTRALFLENICTLAPSKVVAERADFMSVCVFM